MPKVEVIRKGGSRSVKLAARVAQALVKGGGFTYVEDAKISKPKRTPKVENAASRAEAPHQAADAKKEEARPQAARPVTAKTVAPSRKAMTRDELDAMTKADLKVMGQRLGVQLLPSESKDEFVQKIMRYMRRDMRAER